MKRNNKTAEKMMNEIFDPTKLDPVEIFNLYTYAFSEFQTSAIELSQSTWNPEKGINFDRQKHFLDYIVSKLDIFYQIRKLLDCADVYLLPEFSLSRIGDEFALEKAQRYYQEAEKILNEHGDKFAQYRNLVKECITLSLSYCELLREILHPLKFNFSLLYKEDQKNKPSGEQINLTQLIEAENKYDIAIETADKTISENKESAIAFFLKIYHTWDHFFRHERFNSICEETLKILKEPEHPLDNLYVSLFIQMNMD